MSTPSIPAFIVAELLEARSIQLGLMAQRADMRRSDAIAAKRDDIGNLDQSRPRIDHERAISYSSGEKAAYEAASALLLDLAGKVAELS